jgi:acyl carrier protein
VFAKLFLPVMTESKPEPKEAEDDAHLREALKRCSAPTYHAAREFRRTGRIDHLPVIVHGVVERYVDREFRGKMRTPSNELRLAEDLGLDSLSMMEIVMLAEDILRISIDNDELRQLRTLGDVVRFIERKLALVG